jgi:hypothetical protein
MIRIPSVDGIIGKSGLAIYNTVSFRLGETIQYFLTFDDIIKYIHFGKGLGSLTVEGTMFSDCDGNIPGMSKFQQAIRSLRGKGQILVVGNVAMAGIMTDVQLSVTSDPDTMANFVFNYSIVNHLL